MTHLLALVGLGAEVIGGGAGVEVAGEDWLEEGAEDDLSATGVFVSRGRGVWGGRIGTYPVWGRAIHKIRTNLKV
jgi:hypothetical protein